MLNLIKEKAKENKEIKVKKNIKKISSFVLRKSRLRQRKGFLKKNMYSEWMNFLGFIKSTDHLPTDHRPLTHQPTDHRPTDLIISFKRLGNRKIFILQNTHTAENIISVCYLLHLMNNICIHSFERLQKKTCCS